MNEAGTLTPNTRRVPQLVWSQIPGCVVPEMEQVNGITYRQEKNCHTATPGSVIPLHPLRNSSMALKVFIVQRGTLRAGSLERVSLVKIFNELCRGR